MSEIDTSPEAVAFRVNLAKQIARDNGGSALSISLDRTAGILEALAADRDRLAAENAKLREALETVVEERRRDDRCDPDYTFTDKAREQAWDAARTALAKSEA